MKHTFTADDGTTFATAAECKHYEEQRYDQARQHYQPQLRR